jgi:hypothetical protein
MKAKQTVIKLTDHVFRAQEVVEQPPLAECADVSSKDRSRIRAEVAWLVNGHKDVLKLQALELKVSRSRCVSEFCRIRRVVWIPKHVSTVCSLCVRQK